MSVFTKKTTAPLSLEERASVAAAQAAAALSVFDVVAQDLENAATESEQIANLASHQASELDKVADSSWSEAHQRRQQAENIRKLVNPTK